jgi:hypothetical protein
LRRNGREFINDVWFQTRREFISIRKGCAMIWGEFSPSLWLYWLTFMVGSCGVFAIAKRFTDDGHQVTLTRGNFGEEISLREAVWGFLGRPTPILFCLLLVAMWSLRVYLADWSWFDLLVAAIGVAIWPLVEWSVHVFILHARPVKIFGYTYDPIYSRIHRAHHRNPYHPDFAIVPPATLVQYALLIPGILFVFLRWPRPITLGAIVATMAFRYELWHYLIHSSYKPKSKWFRRLRDRHWWHHFRHEGYWYGITTTAGDKLLGTNPDPKSVQLSPTARTLGQDDVETLHSGL